MPSLAAKVPREPLAPRGLWYGALLGLALIVAVVLAGALILASGAADPPVAGPLQLDLASIEPIHLPAPHTQVLSNARDLPVVSALTLEVTAALDTGPRDAAYGFWLWYCDGVQQEVFALDGEGYIVRFAPGSAAQTQPGWTWFPHAAPAPSANRLRLHINAGRSTFYVNDEIATEDTSTAHTMPICAWGLYAATESAGGARVRVDRARVWYTQPFNSD